MAYVFKSVENPAARFASCTGHLMGALMSQENYDVSVEELPGILGYKFDDFDFVSLSEEMSVVSPELVQEFDLEAAYLNHPINCSLQIDDQLIEFPIASGNDLISLLDYLPSVRVEVDCPPNQGLASGVGLLVFLEDGFNVEQARKEIKLFAKFMEEKLIFIKSLNQT